MFIDQELAVESVWKPWSPKLGQRVRIRVSEECPALRAKPHQKEHLTRYHSRSETGRVGIVVRETPGVWNPRQGLAGHAVLVDFYPDAVHFQGCISFCALYFAAEELEPAPEDDSDEDARLPSDAPSKSASADQVTSATPAARKPRRTRRQRKDARRQARQREANPLDRSPDQRTPACLPAHRQ